MSITLDAVEDHAFSQCNLCKKAPRRILSILRDQSGRVGRVGFAVALCRDCIVQLHNVVELYLAAEGQ